MDNFAAKSLDLLQHYVYIEYLPYINKMTFYFRETGTKQKKSC